MWKKALLFAALSSSFLFDEGSSCGGNHLLLYGALGLGVLALLGGRLGTTTTTST